MKKKSIIILGGSGKLGTELNKNLKHKYKIFDFSNISSKKNHFHLDLSTEKNINKFFEKKIKFENLCAIINCLRTKSEKKENFKNFNTNCDIIIKNYYFFINKFINIYKLKNIAIINISSTNVDLISHQPFSYHYTKSVIENLTKFMALELINRKIRVNNLQLGIIRTNNLNKIINLNKIKKIIPLSIIPTHKDIANTICNCFIENQSLNGNTIKLDGLVTNIDQIYFASQLDKKI